MYMRLKTAAKYVLYLFGKTKLLRLFKLNSEPNISRRTFITRFFSLAFVAGLSALALKFGLSNPQVKDGTTQSKRKLITQITPTEEFYKVSKDETVPDITMNEWKLTVDGMVDRQLSLNYQDIIGFQSSEEFVTLECIGNPIGGNLIGNARWKGISLNHILEESGIVNETKNILFEADDGFNNSISFSRAMDGDAFLVYEMNSEPLTREHGFPLRLLIPGFYGYKSVKWLTKIHAIDEHFLGYWESRGRTNYPIIKTMSKIIAPIHNSTNKLKDIAVSGIAYSGDRGISMVELSYDGGEKWDPVDLMSRPLSPFTWINWETNYTPTVTGDMTISVRARDLDGVIQTPIESAVYPDGATGHHNINIFVNL